MHIALVTENPEYAELIKQAASNLSHRISAQVTSIPALRAALKRVETDVVVVAATQINSRKLRQIARIHQTHPCPIAMFVNKSDSSTINAALKSGISAFVVDGLRAERVKAVLDLAVIRFHETQTLQKQLQEANTTPTERSLIRQAIEILINKAHVSENAAYQALYKMALNRNKRVTDVAMFIVTGEQFLAHSPVGNSFLAVNHVSRDEFTTAA
ncbi:MAG TPA: ANTAR domain-containing protein [Gammaproteobacteria bacterium]|nr:ANTAR domain-containing protein [Gammaproteobacteria bacterium]